MVTYKQVQPKVVSNSHSDLLPNAEEESMGGRGSKQMFWQADEDLVRDTADCKQLKNG